MSMSASSSGYLQAAARMASAHDFILGFPAGYDTYVGLQLKLKSLSVTVALLGSLFV